MVKTKILPMRKKSLKNTSKSINPSLMPYSPTEEILDEEFVAGAVFECLKNNDPEGAMEVIEGYLDTVNKTKTSIDINIPRSTLYYSLKSRNPTIKTLAKLIHSTNSLQAKK